MAIDYITGIGNMMTSAIHFVAEGLGQSMSPGFVGLHSSLYRHCKRHNHRSIIEKFYQQLSMVSTAVWHHFSTDKVGFLQYFCMFHHYAPCKTRFGTTWLPKIEAYQGRTQGGAQGARAPLSEKNTWIINKPSLTLKPWPEKKLLTLQVIYNLQVIATSTLR